MKNKMSEKDFVDLYLKEQNMYKSWGEFLKEYIISELERIYMNLDEILKIPVSSRTKEVSSLVEKAFYRNKNYQNPYEDITDKVGIRFVVMRESQIDIIGNIIEDCDFLFFSKDQDINNIREIHPSVFSYQSCHYIVKNTNPLQFNNCEIKSNTPCEIQIRTLGQHIYAEISHDLFYKKKQSESKPALRLLARTSAFNEETDELIERIYKLNEKEEVKYNDFMNAIKNEYSFKIENDKLNRTIYNDIEDLIKKYNIDMNLISNYMKERQYILELINTRTDLLSKQPVVLILYYLQEKHGYELMENWNFPDEILDPIKADLGISMD